MTDDEVTTRLVSWLGNVLPTIPVIRGYQGGNMPSGVYVVVHLTGVVNVRVHEQFFLDFVPELPAQSTSAPVIEKDWRFMLTAIGDRDNATQCLRIIDAARRLTQVLEPLEPEFTIHETGNIVQIGEMEENEWQQQANMTLTLRGVSTDAFEIDVISDIEGIKVTRI